MTQLPLLCPQLTREFFTRELTKHYQGNNDTDVFSATWNSVMITVSVPSHTILGCMSIQSHNVDREVDL